MSLAESIYRHSLSLPESAAREALDFIQFLEHRHGVVSNAELQSDTSKREAALTRLADVRLHFDGKPIANRDELYDGARG